LIFGGKYLFERYYDYKDKGLHEHKFENLTGDEYINGYLEMLRYVPYDGPPN